MRNFFAFLFCFFLITPAPALSEIILTAPPDKLVTYQETLRLEGKASGTSEADINGIRIKTREEGKFSVDLVLHPGKNLVKVFAAGEAAARRILRRISFSDLQNVIFKGKPHWARSAIEDLATLQIIEGYPDNNFEAERAVTKGELATWIARARTLSEEALARDPFIDVPKEHWRAPYIAAAVKAGFIEREPDGSFGLEVELDRGPAVKIFARLAGVEEAKVSAAPFYDVAADNELARFLYPLRRGGYLIGTRPKKPLYVATKELTRAEAAMVLSRLPEVKAAVDMLGDFNAGFTRYSVVNAAPGIVSAIATPGRLPADGKTLTRLEVTVSDPAGLSNISAVQINLSTIGGPENAAMSDGGVSGDRFPGDGIYTLEIVIDKKTPLGGLEFPVAVLNKGGWKAEGKLALTVIRPNNPPEILSALSVPAMVKTGRATKLTLAVKVFDPDGAADIKGVKVDLSRLGTAELSLYDDGTHGDVKAGDGIFMNEIAVPAGLAASLAARREGELKLPITAEDKMGAAVRSEILIVVVP